MVGSALRFILSFCTTRAKKPTLTNREVISFALSFYTNNKPLLNSRIPDNEGVFGDDRWRGWGRIPGRKLTRHSRIVVRGIRKRILGVHKSSSMPRRGYGCPAVCRRWLRKSCVGKGRRSRVYRRWLFRMGFITCIHLVFILRVMLLRNGLDRCEGIVYKRNHSTSGFAHANVRVRL